MVGKITAVLHKVMDAETKGNFTFRTFVLYEEQEYPQVIPFQLNNHMVNIIDQIPIGKEITVHFSLRGREHDGKYYASLVCYKIEGYTSGGIQGQAAASTDQPSTGGEPANSEPANPDDLPF